MKVQVFHQITVKHSLGTKKRLIKVTRGGEYNLGRLYAAGHGVAQDYDKAAHWYRKAANQGLNFALNNLGTLYANGLGVKKDYIQANALYRAAAIQGNVVSEYNLGEFYERGDGVPKDLYQARSWMTKSAAAGLEQAKQWLDAHAKTNGQSGLY